MAAIGGVDAAVRLHLKRGADVNATDERGRSALMLAAQRGHARTCRLLLDAGADHALTDLDGLDALAHAQPGRHADVVLALLEHRSRARPAVQQGRMSHAHSLVAPRGADPPVDTSTWEAEADPVAPEPDLQLVEAAAAIQGAITTHKGLDRDAAWDDVEILLPQRRSRMGAASDLDDELLGSWRALLALGLQAGALPVSAVWAATDQDAIPIEEAEWLLRETLMEFGVAVEEFEPWIGDALDEPLLDVDESEARADEAVEHLLSLRRDRDRVYWSCVGSTRAPQADHRDSAKQCAEIEAGIAMVLGALSRSPPLREGLLASLREVQPSLQKEDDDSERDEGAEEERDGAAARATSRLCELARARALAISSRQEPDLSSEELCELGSARAPVQRLARTLRQRGGLCAEECAYLRGADRWHAGWCAMVTANLRLAVHLVQKSWKNGVPVTDLIQEANTGIMRAAEKYDVRRGTGFATYAAWWVRARVQRHVSCATLVRTPRYAAEIRVKAAQARARFEAAGIEYTTADIAKEVGSEPATLERLVALARDPLPITNHDDAEDDGTDVVGHHDRTPESLVADAELRRLVARHMAELAPREALVLRLRRGLEDGEEHTLSEIGEQLGLSRERIRQIERAGLQQLRRQEGLADLVPGETGEVQDVD